MIDYTFSIGFASGDYASQSKSVYHFRLSIQFMNDCGFFFLNYVFLSQWK